MNMTEELVTKKEALKRVYYAMNGPVNAGKKWVKYERPVVDSMLKVLRELIEKESK